MSDRIVRFVTESHPEDLEVAKTHFTTKLTKEEHILFFAERDAQYRHMFSQVKDIPTMLRILAYRVFSRQENLAAIAYFFSMTEEDVGAALAPLKSVIVCKKGFLLFHHASLPDFLQDRNISQEFCVSEMGADLTILWLKNSSSHRFDIPAKNHSRPIPRIILEALDSNLDSFFQHAEISPKLREEMLKYTPPKNPWKHTVYPIWACNFLHDVQKRVCTLSYMWLLSHKLLFQDFGDDGEVYRTLSDRIVRYVRQNHPKRLENVKIHFTTLTEEELQSAQDLAEEELQSDDSEQVSTDEELHSDDSDQVPTDEELQSDDSDQASTDEELQSDDSDQEPSEEELQSDYGPQPVTTKRRLEPPPSPRPKKRLRRS